MGRGSDGRSGKAKKRVWKTNLFGNKRQSAGMCRKEGAGGCQQTRFIPYGSYPHTLVYPLTPPAPPPHALSS